MPPQHRTSGLRTARQSCEVCQAFEPDETGRCPLCAPSSAAGTGDVVSDLVRQRQPRDGAA